ncbi:MAG: NAD(P)/FAD-dependent oxidoreductase [Planctomycetota bacterium]
MTRRPEVLVIGAGPAGALFSVLLARQGREVVLVDKGSFPRSKVCGCCIAPAGQRAFEQAGLDGLLNDALTLRRMEMAHSGRSVSIPIPSYRTIGRHELDQRLVESAESEGVEFRPNTSARVRPDGICELDNGTLSPGVIVVADGLSGASLREHPGFGWRVRPGSLVGLGTVSDTPDAGLDAHAVTMACAAEGYVGAASIGGGRWSIAAAVTPQLIREQSPSGAMKQIYQRATGRTLALDAPVRGTAPLTRQRNSVEAGTRIFLLGDACGYAEPMTGQGMSWAFEGAGLLAPIVDATIRGSTRPGAWQSVVDRRFRSAHARCAALTRLVRSDAAQALIGLGASLSPRAAGLVARTVLAAGTTGTGAVA